MAEPPEIMAVYVWQNEMVMVFDTAGQQVPEYQGYLADVGERLAAVFPRELWQHGSWNETHRLKPSEDADWTQQTPSTFDELQRVQELGRTAAAVCQRLPCWDTDGDGKCPLGATPAELHGA